MFSYYKLRLQYFIGNSKFIFLKLRTAHALCNIYLIQPIIIDLNVLYQQSPFQINVHNVASVAKQIVRGSKSNEVSNLHHAFPYGKLYQLIPSPYQLPRLPCRS